MSMLELFKCGCCQFGTMYSGTVVVNNSLKSAVVFEAMHNEIFRCRWRDWFCSQNITEIVTVFLFVTTVLYRSVLGDSTNRRSSSREQLLLTHLY